MKQKSKKQFKCEECKDWFPIIKKGRNNKLLDGRKYFHKKIVCEKCYYRLKMNYLYNLKIIAQNGLNRKNEVL
jgi:hypothetical protein